VSARLAAHVDEFRGSRLSDDAGAVTATLLADGGGSRDDLHDTDVLANPVPLRNLNQMSGEGIPVSQFSARVFKYATRRWCLCA